MVSLAHTVGSNNLQMLGGSKQTAGPVPQQSESKTNLQKNKLQGAGAGHDSAPFAVTEVASSVGESALAQYLKANFWISCASST